MVNVVARITYKSVTALVAVRIEINHSITAVCHITVTALVAVRIEMTISRFRKPHTVSPPLWR